MAVSDSWFSFNKSTFSYHWARDSSVAFAYGTSNNKNLTFYDCEIMDNNAT